MKKLMLFVILLSSTAYAAIPTPKLVLDGQAMSVSDTDDLLFDWIDSSIVPATTKVELNDKVLVPQEVTKGQTLFIDAQSLSDGITERAISCAIAQVQIPATKDIGPNQIANLKSGDGVITVVDGRPTFYICK